MRQLVQWVFAGAPGHPALKELCDAIAAGVGRRQSFSADARIDALERTGAGLFTDVLLRHAAQHPPSRRDDPWGVRLLPRLLFGAPSRPAYGLAPDDPGVAVLHHSAGGTWEQGRWGPPAGARTACMHACMPDEHASCCLIKRRAAAAVNRLPAHRPPG